MSCRCMISLRALNEVSNFEKLGHSDTQHPHPHCVRLIRAWEEHGYLYIQTELFEQGTLTNCELTNVDVHVMCI